MINVENKISGWTITGCEDIKLIFDSQIILLSDCLDKITKQKLMDWILDNLRFTKGRDKGIWFCTMDWDTIYKLTIAENYPEIEYELKEHFGEDWFGLYLRFGH